MSNMAKASTCVFPCLVLILLFAQYTTQKECIASFKKGPDGYSCYKAFLEIKNWTDAQSHCQAWHSNLASVTSQEELHFIWDHIINETFYHYWIGLYKDPSDTASTAARDAWKWVDGNTYSSTWTIWRRGQPRTYDTHGLMYTSFTGTTDPYWTGERSGAGRHVFICEHSLRTATPQPTMSSSTSSTPTTLTTSTTVTTATSATTTTSSTPSITMTVSSITELSVTEEAKMSILQTTSDEVHPPRMGGMKSAPVSNEAKLAIGLGTGFAVIILALVGLLVYFLRYKKLQPDSEYDVSNGPSSISILTTADYISNDLYDDRSQTYEYIGL